MQQCAHKKVGALIYKWDRKPNAHQLHELVLKNSPFLIGTVNYKREFFFTMRIPPKPSLSVQFSMLSSWARDFTKTSILFACKRWNDVERPSLHSSKDVFSKLPSVQGFQTAKKRPAIMLVEFPGLTRHFWVDPTFFLATLFLWEDCLCSGLQLARNSKAIEQLGACIYFFFCSFCCWFFFLFLLP